MKDILQVVNGDGEFNTSGVAEFVHETGVESAGVGYTVVAIMGPQSSGKSTLLNNLFGTRFEEMDALAGRRQTTRGIWLARSPKVAAPITLVMDLEGSDGRERGEDDTSFERQSALFALATADILLVNMWAKDVGRETGSGKPLLKTIFQVNLKLFQPSPGARRTVLLFVLRDRTKTPLERLKETWEADLNRMWAAIAKPPAYEESTIADFFDVQYAALSNYEDRTEEFMAETTLLRRRFTDEADEDDGLLRQSPHKLPGQALTLSMNRVWEVVQENKDLNLPAHRVMVANIRCSEIATDIITAFEANTEWQDLATNAQTDLIPGFGAKAGALLESALNAYEEEARYFDAGVSAARLETLTSELHALIRPAFEAQLNLASTLAMNTFRLAMTVPGKSPFEGGSTEERTTFVQRAVHCTTAALADFDAAARDIILANTDWTAANARETLQRELAAHQAALRAEHIAASLDAASKSAAGGVSSGAMPLFESPSLDLWPRLVAVVERETKSAAAGLAQALNGYGIDAAEEGELRGRVRAAARARLLANAKEAANTVLPRLKDRFAEVFQKDDQGMPRTWGTNVDISAVAADARRASALLLSQLCVVRWATTSSGQSRSATGGKAAAPSNADAVELAIMNLADAGSSNTGLSASAAAQAVAAADFDLLSASDWPSVAQEDVLLSPAQARAVWRQFSSDVALSIQQAIATQEANKLAQNKLPPLWAILAMVLLGFNEFVAVLRNPFLLVLVVVVVLFARTVYVELDVEGELARGLLPGAMALSAKFLPTVQSVARRTFESGKAFLDATASTEGENNNDARTPREHAEHAERAGGRSKHDGVRARRKEVELTPGDINLVGGDLVGRGNRKDN